MVVCTGHVSKSLKNLFGHVRYDIIQCYLIVSGKNEEICFIAENKYYSHTISP